MVGDDLRDLLEICIERASKLIQILTRAQNRAQHPIEAQAQHLGMARDLLQAQSLTRDLAQDLARARTQDLARAWAQELARALTRVGDLSRTLNLDLNQALDLAEELAVDLDLTLDRLQEDTQAETDSRSEALEITVEVPEDISPERLREIIRQAALTADTVHRSHGGQGLQIDSVDIFERSQVPEGTKQ